MKQTFSLTPLKQLSKLEFLVVLKDNLLELKPSWLIRNNKGADFEIVSVKNNYCTIRLVKTKSYGSAEFESTDRWELLGPNEITSLDGKLLFDFINKIENKEVMI